MQLQTSRFGLIEIDDGAIITFTQPIIGFQEYRRFVLLPGPNDAVQWLQSTDSGDLAFILMNPRNVIPDYAVELTEHELAELAVSSAEELEVYSLVVVPHDPAQIRTNLKAPILINRKVRLGKQTILERSTYPIQHFLTPTKRGAGRPREVSNARSDA